MAATQAADPATAPPRSGLVEQHRRLPRLALPGLFALGAALMAWFEDIAPWLDFQGAQTAIWDWSSSGEDWAQLVVSGIIWLGLPLGFGIRRVLRAEVK